MIVVAGVLWGTSGVFVHYMTPYGFSPLQLTALRGSVALAFMALTLPGRRPSPFAVDRRQLLLCMGSGLGFFATASCYYAAMRLVGVSTAAVLMYTAPVLVLLYSAVFLGERLTAFKSLLILMMPVGCVLVSGGIGSMRFDLLGILLGIASAFAYAAYNVFTKLALRRGADASTVTFYTFLFMAMAAILSCRPWEMVACVVKAPAATLLWSLGLGVVTAVLPYFLYALALRVLPAGTASALSVVEPVSATLFGVFLLREEIDLYAGIGILLILLAVCLLSLGEKTGERGDALATENIEHQRSISK